MVEDEQYEYLLEKLNNKSYHDHDGTQENSLDFVGAQGGA